MLPSFFFDWHFSGEPSLRYMVLFLFSRWNDFLIESTGILLFFFWPVRLLCSLLCFGLMGLSLGVCNAYACIYFE